MSRVWCVVAVSSLAACGHTTMKVEGTTRYQAPSAEPEPASLVAQTRSEGGYRSYQALFVPTETGLQLELIGLSNERAETDPDRWRVWIEDGHGGVYEPIPVDVSTADVHAEKMGRARGSLQGRYMVISHGHGGQAGQKRGNSVNSEGNKLDLEQPRDMRRPAADGPGTGNMRDDRYGGTVVMRFEIPALTRRELDEMTVALETPSNSVRFRWRLVQSP